MTILLGTKHIDKITSQRLVIYVVILSHEIFISNAKFLEFLVERDSSPGPSNSARLFLVRPKTNFGP